MAKSSQKEGITYVGELPPPRTHSGGRWLQTLTPLLKERGRGWFLIKEFDRPEQAHDAQNNLSQRKVRIPEPEHDWGFAARGCELFAVYRGPTRPVRRQVHKKKTK